jgi:hypothetical protein
MRSVEFDYDFHSFTQHLLCVAKGLNGEVCKRKQQFNVKEDNTCLLFG